jgi:hypothetical protein
MLWTVKYYVNSFRFSWVFFEAWELAGRGGKIEGSTRALLAGNVKQLQEIRLNENLKETLTPMSHYGRNDIWLTDIIP